MASLEAYWKEDRLQEAESLRDGSMVVAGVTWRIESREKKRQIMA